MMQTTGPMSSHPAMHPHLLDFTNPQPYLPMSTSQSSRTPMALTPTYSDTSPHSSESSSLAPSLSSLALGRECGCPHKVFPPMYDDYPHGASQEEIQEYFKCKKKTKMWRFQKLMSGEGSEYRRNEKECSLKCYYDKKASKTGGEGFDDINELPDDDMQMDDQEYKRSLSRQRYNNLCVTFLYFTYFIEMKGMLVKYHYFNLPNIFHFVKYYLILFLFNLVLVVVRKLVVMEGASMECHRVNLQAVVDQVDISKSLNNTLQGNLKI